MLERGQSVWAHMWEINWECPQTCSWAVPCLFLSHSSLVLDWVWGCLSMAGCFCLSMVWELKVLWGRHSDPQDSDPDSVDGFTLWVYLWHKFASWPCWALCWATVQLTVEPFHWGLLTFTAVYSSVQRQLTELISPWVGVRGGAKCWKGFSLTGFCGLLWLMCWSAVSWGT